MECTTLRTFRNLLSPVQGVRWRLGRRQLEYSIRKDVSEIDAASWNALNTTQSVFLDLPYLRALERSLSGQDEFRYITFSFRGTPCGIAVLHLTRFETDQVSTLAESNGLIRLVSQSFRKEGKQYTVLLCGNAFATGEHGYSFTPDISVQAAMDGLCYALTEVLNEEKRCSRPIDAVLVKDFYSHRFKDATALGKCGFRSFNVDHNMILPIDPSWVSFEDYLSGMNTKFRTKANAALKRSEPLIPKDLSAEEIQLHAADLERLYNDVFSRADFRLGHMTAKAFKALKEELGEKMMMRAYFYQERMVGFLSAFVCGDRLDAHLVGIDYSLNQELAIYQRMLYDYVELAISNRSRLVVFGRTAAEIKSGIGAFPVDLQCCIRHPGRISNVMVNYLFSYVRPSNFPRRKPWKVKTEQELLTMMPFEPSLGEHAGIDQG